MGIDLPVLEVRAPGLAGGPDCCSGSVMGLHTHTGRVWYTNTCMTKNAKSGKTKERIG